MYDFSRPPALCLRSCVLVCVLFRVAFSRTQPRYVPRSVRPFAFSGQRSGASKVLPDIRDDDALPTEGSHQLCADKFGLGFCGFDFSDEAKADLSKHKDVLNSLARTVTCQVFMFQVGVLEEPKNFIAKLSMLRVATFQRAPVYQIYAPLAATRSRWHTRTCAFDHQLSTAGPTTHQEETPNYSNLRSLLCALCPVHPLPARASHGQHPVACSSWPVAGVLCAPGSAAGGSLPVDCSPCDAERREMETETEPEGERGR